MAIEWTAFNIFLGIGIIVIGAIIIRWAFGKSSEKEYTETAEQTNND